MAPCSKWNKPFHTRPSHASNRMERIVLPELLDALPPRDESALRSRRDIRRLNGLMRHPRLMTRALERSLRDRPTRRIVELGAGDGHFLLGVAERMRESRLDVEA